MTFVTLAPPITIGADLLLSVYQSRTAVAGAPTAAATAARIGVPTSPWAQDSTAPQADELVQSVLAGRPFIQPDAVMIDVPGASEDYRKLFGLYQGLNALNAVAERSQVAGVSSFEQATLERRFAAGLAEVDAYMQTLQMEQLRLVRGEALTTAKTAVGVPRDVSEYVTGMVHTGRMDEESAALLGDVRFSIDVRRSDGSVTAVAIDLAEMSGTRSFGNLINHLNSELAAAGLVTRFDRVALPSEPRTVMAGGQPVVLPATGERWAMKVVGIVTETVTFTAPESADAVYMAQTGGLTNPVLGTTATQRLVKFQTDVGGTPPPAYQPPDEANWTEGRVFSQAFSPEVAAVRATATGADGSVYVVADVTGTTSGQTLQGERDVALLKYDAAGNLLFTRTLGAGGEASGYALSVSADGKVAVAGSVTGALGGTTSPASTLTDSVVTLYDAEGQELWTQRRAATAEDEAQAVAFGDDGTVYVGGRTRSGIPGGTAVGGWDGYVQSFRGVDGVALSTQQFGTVGTDGVTALAVQGSTVMAAGTENGHAVLRGFTVGTGGALTAGAVRDLGDLAGGRVAGVAFDGAGVVVAGMSSNGALSAGAVTTGYSGGRDGFVARLSSDLSASADDRLSWFGGAGEDTVTAMAVKDGQVYLAGQSDGDLPGSTPLGARDGFLVRLDAGTGAVGWSQRFTDTGGQAAPTAIAVAAGGASVLDRLGLPKGTLDYTGSRQITAATSVRPGDNFYVRTVEGAAPVAVTIAAGDTLQSLALKINRALGFNAQATVVTDGAVQRLQILPRNERTFVEILPGRGDLDALTSLGLAEGVVSHSTYDTETETDVASEIDLGLYGLKLDRDLNLDDPEQIRHSLAELASAMVVIRTAYSDLRTAATPPSLQPITAAPSPYMQRQIAGYQEALARLTGVTV